MPRQAGLKIILVRHGQSEANVAHCINDDPLRPVGLTELGREQAEAVASELAALDFDCAYVSEFPRARQTAGIILSGRACPLMIDARLNERRSGMDGQPVHAFNELIRPDPVNFRPENGESFLEEMARLNAFLDEVHARHAGGRILAVSHENPILAALALSGMAPIEAALGSIANCATVELSWPNRL